MKITTIFDNVTRPDTTGVYLHNAFVELGHIVDHVNPFKDEIKKGADLYVMVDDGRSYELSEKLKSPLIYWAIDTHISMQNQIDKSRKADFIFAAQIDGARILSQEISKEVMWLPLACDLNVHKKIDSKEEFDISFIGNVVPKLMDQRIEYLDYLFKKVPNFDFGRAFGDELPKRIAKSKIVVNKSIRGDMNMRVFETLAMGKLLVTDYLPVIGKLFVDGEHLIMYRSKTEMVEKVKYYLKHDNERKKIAENGRNAVMKHTYKDRAEIILKNMI